ncbi:diguanylate cyclase [Aquitalea sp. ASV11]|uniref:GGDEF domain-containing protein n=1 Tax=Aquitalea sp. ASV11 TaxID=2795103 RepID=UPI0018EE4588|nr:diguanylate cyclase [Aquitalea sp. ASV11]
MAVTQSIPILLPVFVVTELLCACNTVQLWSLKKAGVSGTRSWLLANAAMLGYLPALGLRMVLPLIFSVVLSNGLGLVAASMFYIGCARFLGRPSHARPLALLVLAGVAGLLGFTLLLDSMRVRVVIASGGISIVFAATAWLLFRHRIASHRATVYWLGAACSAVTSLLHLGRAVYYGGGFGNISDLFATTMPNVFSMSLTAALVPGLSMLAVAMVQEYLLRDATWRAEHDGMTGLNTRQCFESRSMVLLQQAEGSNLPLCLVLMDLDHFKQINDRHGHQAGDQVLLTFSELLRQGMRPADVTGRMGGEEFALLLPQTPPAQALAMAENLRLRAAEIPAVSLGGSIPYSVSMGLAVWQPGMSFTELYRHADQALYAAKKAGRNQVMQAAQPA